MPTIDLNCDMGESFGAWKMGCDLEILDQVTSANIACGFHAGDPDVMLSTVRAAVARGVALGAHPGLPDLQGFGRREMVMTPSEIYALVVYQVGALQGFAQAANTRLHHVKPHGALYNMTTKNLELARAVAQAVFDVDRSLQIYVANANITAAALDLGLTVAYEVYADRTYQDNGTLTPRSQPHAMIEDVDTSIAQVRRMISEGKVKALSGLDVDIRADTLCIHGDQPGALNFAQRLREALTRDGIELKTT